MHDIFEGMFPLEVKVVLKYLINELKFEVQ